MRFEVFKRDGFTCQYCGMTPPGVILHIDHINPVSMGGGNDIDNLITSCEPCNLGKSATPLTDVPKSMQDRASDIAEREAQIRGYNKILQDKADRIDAECWIVAAELEGEDYVESYNRKRLESIRMFLERLPVAEVKRAASITLARWGETSRDKTFRYFCGVCWRKIREQENG